MIQKINPNQIFSAPSGCPNLPRGKLHTNLYQVPPPLYKLRKSPKLIQSLHLL